MRGMHGAQARPQSQPAKRIGRFAMGQKVRGVGSWCFAKGGGGSSVRPVPVPSCSLHFLLMLLTCRAWLLHVHRRVFACIAA